MSIKLKVRPMNSGVVGNELNSFVILKFAGVRPSNLVTLHAFLESEENKAVPDNNAFMFCTAPWSKADRVPILELLKSKSESGRYVVEIKVPRYFRVSADDEQGFVIVPKSCIIGALVAVGWFPDKTD